MLYFYIRFEFFRHQGSSRLWVNPRSNQTTRPECCPTTACSKKVHRRKSQSGRSCCQHRPRRHTCVRQFAQGKQFRGWPARFRTASPPGTKACSHCTTQIERSSRGQSRRRVGRGSRLPHTSRRPASTHPRGHRLAGRSVERSVAGQCRGWWSWWPGARWAK